MKKYQSMVLPLLAWVLLLTVAACDKDDEEVMGKIAPSASGTFVDERDGHEYHWVRYGSLDWMADNFSYDLKNEQRCLVYLNAEDYEYNRASTKNLAKYGRLYDLPGALEACPEGWRVPTDADWQNLECCLGMSPDEAAKMDWRGNIAHRMFSLEDDPCDLNLRLGGYWTTNINMSRSPYRMMGLFGYYWSSSLDEQKEGMYYLYRKFAYNRNEVCRQSIESEKVKLYVRYVRDAH